MPTLQSNEALDDRDSEFVRQVAAHYLGSHDFNGLAIRWDNNALLSLDEKRAWLRRLVISRNISLRFGDVHANPAIRHFPDPEVAAEIELLQRSDLNYVVAYPKPVILEPIVNRDIYTGRPFSLRLALGEAQLDYHCFDLIVLEHYRNDPRYAFWVNDVNGTISINDAFYGNGSVPEADKISLQAFGFAYDEDMGRYVAVFTRYLHDLSAKHQQIWETMRVTRRHNIHPDYLTTSIRGMFPSHIPILSAFTLELHHINEMCVLMGKPQLFKNSYNGDGRPRNFMWLIRPTEKEFTDFIFLLDQMVSDNINKDFFRGEVELESQKPRGDGKIVVEQRGTLALLEEWFFTKVILSDPQPVNAMLATFRKIRNLRSPRAHVPLEDKYDQKYFKDQRELIIAAYKGMRLIRLLLQNHPACKEYKVEDFLRDGCIRDF